MKRYTQPLCTMNMGHARWICDNHIGNERASSIVDGIVPKILSDLMQMCSITHFKTRFPAAVNYLLHLSSTLLDSAAPYRADLWKKTGILDHECHQLLRITANVEKLQSIFENILAEGQVCRKSHSMTMGLQNLPQCKKRLNISAGTNNLNDYVKMQWKRFSLFIVKVIEGFPLLNLI